MFVYSCLGRVWPETLGLAHQTANLFNEKKRDCSKTIVPSHYHGEVGDEAPEDKC
jgi:hypothetical protein